jgi:hypothetical protein
MKLPTAEEIDPHGGLDAGVACKNFLGKTLDEAEALFQENSLRYQADLMWMGPVAFRYYVPAAIRYIKSDAAAEDSDIINCFAGLLEFRLKYESAELAPIAEQLATICNHITEHYERFGLTPEIYGDVRARFKKLQQRFLRI